MHPPSGPLSLFIPARISSRPMIPRAVRNPIVMFRQVILGGGFIEKRSQVGRGSARPDGEDLSLQCLAADLVGD